MGNRSKRGRPDPDAPDPVGELQEVSRWSGWTSQNIRWGPHVRLARLRVPRKSRLPSFGAWIGIMLLGLAVLGAVTLVIWLPSLLFD